jgi:hypothetical protein
VTKAVYVLHRVCGAAPGPQLGGLRTGIAVMQQLKVLSIAANDAYQVTWCSMHTK